MKYNESELREAVEAFFNGTLSQSDTVALLHTANLFESCAISVSDSRLASDLHSIHILGKYSQNMLNNLEAALTPEIQQRLDRHVARLAAGSSHKWSRLKWCGAAACLALLLSAGLHFLIEDPASQPDSGNTILIAAVINDSDTSEVGQLAGTPSGNSTASDIPSPAMEQSIQAALRPSSAPKARTRNKHITIPAERIPESVMLNLTASVNVPEHLTVPNPQVVTAMSQEAEIAQLIASPLSAISKTFDSMRESLNIVNATIYEAHKSTVTLSEAFIEASSAPIRSI